jgi:hypothetical protein
MPSDCLVIIPTRGRPHSVEALAQAWDDTDADSDVLLCIDSDDPEAGRYRYEWEELDHPRFGLREGPRLRLAGTLNAAMVEHVDEYKVIAFMGDDHRPRTKGWDRRFAECLSGGTGIVYGNDLLVGDRFPTAVWMTSDIPARLSYLCPPGFTHLCLDLVWKDWGQGIGRITYLDDVIIEHVHPAAQKAPLDLIYEEVNSEQMVSRDTEAYYHYRDHVLPSDLDKLRELL